MEQKLILLFLEDNKTLYWKKSFKIWKRIYFRSLKNSEKITINRNEGNIDKELENKFWQKVTVE